MAEVHHYRPRSCGDVVEEEKSGDRGIVSIQVRARTRTRARARGWAPKPTAHARGKAMCGPWTPVSPAASLLAAARHVRRPCPIDCAHARLCTGKKSQTSSGGELGAVAGVLRWARSREAGAFLASFQACGYIGAGTKDMTALEHPTRYCPAFDGVQRNPQGR
jgi:hypothetical protein